MTQEQWTAVDRYITDLLVRPDPALDAALQASAAAGLPPINVSPNQGKLLLLLARVQAARSILEIGTLGGYSTIWLARALPPDHAGGGPKACRSRPRQHRARWAGQYRRAAPRPGAGYAAAARGRGSRPI
jgi:O-methyltransferase